ncbi:hypothetical protein [Pontibacter anaerobius]|uniref:Uncharacterized protein n=1 Tax=Pontibacter anaerobius TaxID=2993940 RepID=A0ABT3RDH0_9BACT|nr:hypothetical protein [Pontibacter anaerobius]MCX2739488.1 hypothetical protein [Pontibacter anaerobius]
MKLVNSLKKDPPLQPSALLYASSFQLPDLHKPIERGITQN